MITFSDTVDLMLVDGKDLTKVSENVGPINTKCDDLLVEHLTMSLEGVS